VGFRRVPQVALSFDEKSGAYNHHRVNQEHLIGYDASQTHQKVAAILTLGELLVEGTIPIGTFRAGEFDKPPNEEQIKDAFESYPWFKWKRGVMTLEQKFKMNLKSGDDELFKDACIDIYKKSCVIGGDYTNFDMCQKRVLKTWTKFGLDDKKKPPLPPPPAPAATAAAAAAAAAAAPSSAAAAANESKLSEKNATVWKLLAIFSADTVDRLEEHCGAIGGDGGKLMQLKDLQAAVCGEDGTDISKKRRLSNELCGIVINDFTKVLGAKPEPE
jgi:hypothetical protein